MDVLQRRRQPKGPDMRSLRPARILLLTLAFLSCPAWAGDWPTWRHDCTRGAATPDALPTSLKVQWSRQLPAPRPAWPASQYKLQFDASYEPVVAGKRLFVGSMVNDSVTAYETETGKQVWRFYADGPVRFAPSVAGGKVYFVSDDGCLYCLDAAGGKLLWKKRGGPDERKIIGNDRLTSMWPARGGPAIRDGKVYWAAGIWPFMGTFIYCTDAETGETVWCNSGSGSRYTTQQHSAPSFAGVAPQGYLAVTADTLLVPGGRTVPAAYDRATGAYRYFHVSSRQFDKGSGGYNVSATDKVFFNRNATYLLSDGSGIEAGAADVIDGETAYLLRGGKLTVRSLKMTMREVTVKDKRGKARKVKKSTWASQRDVPVGDAISKLLLKAGPNLYGTDKAGVVALSIGTSARAVWRGKVEGTVTSMLAADDKLFVVTKEGRLTCFGTKGGGDVTPPRRPAPPRNVMVGALVDWLLPSTDRSGGYCVVFGMPEPAFLVELVHKSDLHIVILDPDAAQADATRRMADEAGWYGTRVTVLPGDLANVPLPPYLAGVVIGGELPDGKEEAPALRTAFRMLRPYGGVFCFRESSAERRAALQKLVRTSEMAGARLIEKADGIMQLRRNGPLPGSASWSHQYADAGNSVVGRDRLVKAPLGLLWFGGPSNDKILPRHGHGPSPQVAGGRLFIEGPNVLRCVDVYTGRVLWEREMPNLGRFYNNTAHQPGANEIGSNYVSLPDAVYVAYDRKILKLNAASGDMTREFALPGKPNFGYLGVEGDLLIATTSPMQVSPGGKGGASKPAAAPAADLTPVIPPGADWQYLAGSHAKTGWTQIGFKAATWKTGKAGFGYGDGDDNTVLNMKGKYTAVYIRTSFQVPNPAALAKLTLMLNYDDAFVAYLNGKEIARAGVQGAGAKVKKVTSHEAEGHQQFAIRNAAQLLRKGTNVLAVEGHNRGAGSSDFTLDPWLGTPGAAKASAPKPPAATAPIAKVPGVTLDTPYSSASRTLVVMDRRSGKVLWTRDARYAFRHNAVAAAGGKIFCIDRVTNAKLAHLQRRGYTPAEQPTLYALDARTGRVVWKTDRDVFGTWLGYSPKHNVLVQAGSASRDRAKDEVGSGIVVYRADTGAVVWADRKRPHNGPLVLWGDLLITNGGGGGEAYELLSGKPATRTHPLTGAKVQWEWRRKYGCNTAVASEHLLLFRSGAAGYLNLTGGGGTGNLGGFKSGCTSNLIAADGLLNAPDYTRTCQCSYQNQTSLAMMHMPGVETWTFDALPAPAGPIVRVGLNFGAPGDRIDEAGTLWLDTPSAGGPSPDPKVALIDKPSIVRHHSSLIKSGNSPAWIAASGIVGAQTISIPLGGSGKYTIRLHFAEIENLKAGERIFDVAVQGRKVLTSFDVARTAGGAMRSVVKEFTGVTVNGTLTVTLTSKKGRTLLCGLEAVRTP
jgi:outer membrane protein assembly factor BamB